MQAVLSGATATFVDVAFTAADATTARERRWAGRERRSTAVVADTTVRSGDPLRVFSARIELSLPPPEGHRR
ncbi:MAG: hypothetical protein IPK26_19845 [Planctomycetes bacterium]|nr:hypothetical protein [Planctomycetota bacterium]